MVNNIRIQKKISGNCGCFNCGKRQQGLKPQPYTVWYKFCNENRGHNAPVCSKECAEKFAKQVAPTIKRMDLSDLV